MAWLLPVVAHKSMGDLAALGAPSADDVDLPSYLELDDVVLGRRLRHGDGYDRDSDEHRPTAPASAEASFCPAFSPASSTAFGPPSEADAPGHAMRIAHAHMELYLPAAEYEVVLTVLRAMRRGEMTELRAQQLVEAVLAEHPALHAQFVAALRAEGGSHDAETGASRKRQRGLEGLV